MQALAATLTCVGVAGLLFAAVGVLSGPSASTAADEPLLFSVGDVPAPSGPTPETLAHQSVAVYPELPTREAGVSQSGSGNFTEGWNGGAVSEAPGPAPPSGVGTIGQRQVLAADFLPSDIYIPKINLAARIVPVGTTSAGAMETPRRYSEIGWWSPGAQPGEPGRAVLAGHVDSPWGAAVFIDLDELEPGDEIVVGNGHAELRFVVRGVAVYRTSDAPVEDIFGPSTESELILITCGGTFDRRSASYLHRRVVFAVLAEAEAGASTSYSEPAR